MNLFHGLIERPKRKLLGVMWISAKQKRGGIQPIPVFGNKALGSAFLVLVDFLPNLHYARFTILL